MTDSLRIVVAGGGTGGHVYPGIAIVERLEARIETHARFVGVRGGVEEAILARAGRDHVLLPGYGIRRANIARKLGAPFMLAASVVRAMRLLADFRADVVLGTGGYASAAVVVASMALRTPRVLQEQNSVPGLVNRRLAPNAQLVLLGYAESVAWFKEGTPSLVVGNPMRRMPSTSRAEGARFFDLDPSRPTVLVVGGSRGAHSLNMAAAEAAAQLSASRSAQFIVLCGAVDRAEVERRTERVAANVRVLEYLDEMHFAYAACDVAVARSGASSVFELAAFGVPSIFVPYPYAADAHQQGNAEPLVEAGGAVVVADSEVSGDRLERELDALLADKARRLRMSAAMRAWSKPDAADRAADAILAVAKKKEMREQRLAA